MIRLYLIIFLQEAKAEEDARREEQEAQKKREEFEEANRMRREQEREQLAGYPPHLLNPLTEEEEVQLRGHSWDI